MDARRRPKRACRSRTSRRRRPAPGGTPCMLDWQFSLLLLSNGVLIGLMYSLIALGFVLVYKATDAVNFAQGEFVMIAGFIVVGGLTVVGAPLWASVLGGL